MQLRLRKGELEFRVSEEAANESMSIVLIQKGQRMADGSWHHINLIFGTEHVMLAVDYRRPDYVDFKQVDAPSLSFEEDSSIVIGIGYIDSQPGKYLKTKD